MTIKEYCESCKNKGSHKCHSCMGRYYDGVLLGKPTKYIKKQQTNADRIRAKSDEELAKFLGEYQFADMCDEGCEKCTYHGDCDKRILEWLKQPVEE